MASAVILAAGSTVRLDIQGKIELILRIDF